jgi:hypothetical protein
MCTTLPPKRAVREWFYDNAMRRSLGMLACSVVGLGPKG